MGNQWITYSLAFVVIVLIQGLVVNNIQLSEYLNPMVYPLAILMLPFGFSGLLTMAVALVLGILVDAFSNTFGLHASAALLIGYTRPTVMHYLRPRDGYDTFSSPNVHDMGLTWFFSYCSAVLLIHHLWLFTIEIFRFDLVLLILGKTSASFLFSFALIVLLQYLLYKPPKK